MAHIVGTNGNDSLVGTSGVDTIEGLGGNDTLVGLGGNDSLNGGLGNDRYVVGTGDVLSDAGGTDTIETAITWHLAAGFENLIATGNASTSHGGNNLANHITGNAGANWIAGREGNDTLLGGAGGDTFNMSNGAGASYGTDSIDGGTGTDTLDFGAAARTAVTVNLVDGTASGGGTGGAGSATLVSIENVNGSAFGDSIRGGDEANFFFGFDGDDYLHGGEGGDRLEGGAGNDTLDGSINRFATSEPDVDTLNGGMGDDVFVVDNSADVLIDAGGTDTVIAEDRDWTLGAGFENLVMETDESEGGVTGFGNGLDNHMQVTWAGNLEGGGGNDTLVGGRATFASDTLSGGDGNDLILGRLFDVLNGGAGSDTMSGEQATMTGGAGDDHFGMHSGVVVTDFATAADKLTLDGSNSIFTNVGPSGNFAPGDERFYAAAGATESHDASDRLIYNTTTGELYYDHDGAGGSAADYIALLEGAPTLTANDIEVINGSSGGSVINGTEGDDLMWGTSGDDAINLLGGDDGVHMYPFAVNGDYGDDVIDGGDGFDALYFSDDGQARTGIVADLSAGVITGGGPDGAGSVQVSGIEFIEGTMLSDLLIGDDEDNWLSGGWGADTLAGGAGNDTMAALDSGGNTYVFAHYGAAHWDYMDIMSSADRIVLDGTAFTAIGPSGSFAPNDARFFEGAGAISGQTASHRIIHDTNTGDVWYDADGNGTGVAQLVANLFGGGQSLLASQFEVVNGSAGGSTINGTEGDDSLTGTPGDDTINGLAGNDTIQAGEGADSISGGSGNDSMFAGLDSVLGDGAADTLDGGLGDDTYRHVSTFDGDVVLADAGGMDTVFAIGDHTLGGGLENLRFDDFFGGRWTGVGNELNNTIVSASEGGDLFGMGGNDLLVLEIGSGFGAAHGGDGNDTLDASRNSELFGDAGDDTLIAWAIGSTMSGGSGNDSFVFESAAEARHQVEDFASGVDKIRLDATNMTELGASGNFAAGDARFHIGAAAHDADDRVIYNSSTAELFYDADGNGAGAAEQIATLQAGATVLATDIAVDNGTGGGGGSTINGTANNDTLVGGAGNDTINGLAGADLLQGLGGNDSIVGGTGWDTIQGGDGGDWLQGGGWSDTMTGGAGADSFVFAEAGTNNRDTVTDFASGTDELMFENGTLTAMGAAGAWAAGDARFHAAAGAVAGHDADDRLVYNTTTGNLYYDADGSGSGAAQVIATFTGTPGIAATDITVI